MEIMRKTYQVFYWVKQNRHEYLNHMFVLAASQTEACKKVKQVVLERTGRNAFRPSCKAPNIDEYKNNPYYVVG